MKVFRILGDLAISINGTKFKQVKLLKYLGSIFTQDGRLERDRNRTQKGNVVSYELELLLKRTSIPMETNAKLINSIFNPTLPYQCQTWTVIKILERKIATCKLRCLRRAVNKTRRDRIRNEIREGQRNGRNNTNPTPYRQRIICFRHLTRMGTNQLAQQA